MATAIVCNNAVTVIAEEHHLVFPVVTAQGPPVGEGYDGSSGVAPVLVEELGSVSKLQVWHGCEKFYQ